MTILHIRFLKFTRSNLSPWLIVNLALITATTTIVQTSTYKELIGCTHRLSSDQHLVTVCMMYAKSDINTQSVELKPQGLILKHTMVSLVPINRTIDQVTMGISRIVITKANSGLKDYKDINVFSFGKMLRFALIFLKRVNISVNIYHKPDAVLVKASPLSIGHCLVTRDCSLKVFDLGNNLNMNVEVHPVSFIHIQMDYVVVFKNFLARWRVNKQNTVIENFEVTFVQLTTLKPLAYGTASLELLNITKLSLANSNLLSIGNSSSIFPIPDLKSLSLSTNRLTYIRKESFQRLINLRKLNISHNNFHAIPEGIFSLPKLEQLDMTNTLVDGTKSFLINVKSKDGVPKSSSKVLLLSNTRLNRLNSDAFQNFPNLTKLELKNCQISQVSAAAFRNVNNLKILDLSNNKIRSMSSEVFLELKKMTVLVLRNNSFESMEILQKINPTFVNLDENVIKPWKESVLSTSNKTMALSLRKNNITIVTTAMKNDFLKFDSVDLKDNPFDCGNCNFPEMQKLITEGNSFLKNSSSYVCASPDDAKCEQLAIYEFPMDSCQGPDYVAIGTGLAIGTFLGAIALFCLYHCRWKLLYLVLLSKSKVRRLLRTTSVDGGYSYDAFVCYCDKDLEWIIHHLLPELEQGNGDHEAELMKLCIHERDFFAGSSITDNIVGSLSQSRKVLLVVSEGFINSRWCLYETHLAQHRMYEENRDAIVIIMMDDLDNQGIPKHVNYLLSTRTYLKWPKEEIKRKLFWSRLRVILHSDDELKMSVIP